MAIAVDPQRTIRYVLLQDAALPLPEQTTFLLKTFSARELAQIEDGSASISATGEQRVYTGSMRLRALEIALVGWENFKERSGLAVPFDEVNRGKNLDRLAPEWRREMANHVLAETRLTEAEVKN